MPTHPDLETYHYTSTTSGQFPDADKPTWTHTSDRSLSCTIAFNLPSDTPSDTSIHNTDTFIHQQDKNKNNSAPHTDTQSPPGTDHPPSSTAPLDYSGTQNTIHYNFGHPEQSRDNPGNNMPAGQNQHDHTGTAYSAFGTTHCSLHC
jgi:hypothetical protein